MAKLRDEGLARAASAARTASAAPIWTLTGSAMGASSGEVAEGNGGQQAILEAFGLAPLRERDALASSNTRSPAEELCMSISFVRSPDLAKGLVTSETSPAAPLFAPERQHA